MIGDKLKDARTAAGYTQTEMAELINVSKQTLYKYENNIITNVPSDKIEHIARICNVSPAHLMGWDSNVTPISLYEGKTRAIPVLGRVAAGIPIEMIEDVIDEEEIPADWPGDYFALKIHGDSMEPRISEGDVVIVKQQPDIENGQVAIITIDGEDATCKRVMKYADGIMLISSNPKYPPMQYSKEDMKSLPIRILGRVVELRAKF